MNQIVLPTFVENCEFINPEAKRQYQKIILSATFHIFSEYGFDEGIAGHITFRDPLHSDLFWVNPFGLHFSLIEPEDLILVDWNGKIIEGKHKKLNVAAFVIHSAIHEAQPEINAVAHAHSIYGRVWSTTGRLLEPTVIEATPFFNDHVLFDDLAGVASEKSEGISLAKKLNIHKAAILKNHGHLTVGKSIEEAAWWFIAFERACQIQVLAESIGKPLIMNDLEAKKGFDQLGGGDAARFQFSPILEKYFKKNPILQKNLQKCLKLET